MYLHCTVLFSLWGSVESGCGQDQMEPFDPEESMKYDESGGGRFIKLLEGQLEDPRNQDPQPIVTFTFPTVRTRCHQ